MKWTDLENAHLNSVWCELMMEEWYRQGVRLCCIAPGSRSTPLTLAAARHPGIDTVIHYDERGLAFFALGAAKASGQPVIWVTTSGSAVANGLPAMIEAWQSSIPLIALTADRPPELRDCGANQAINQVNLFADCSAWRFDMPCPDTALPASFVLATAGEAASRAKRDGPVHLNCMFREPLAPGAQGQDLNGWMDSVAAWADESRPYTRVSSARRPVSMDGHRESLSILESTERGVLIAGELCSDEERAAVVEMGNKLRWPVLADVASGLRLGTSSPCIPGPFEALIPAGETPGAVIRVGGAVVSKALESAEEAWSGAKRIQIRDAERRRNPRHVPGVVLEGDIAAACTALTDDLPAKTSTDWLEQWTRRADAAQEKIEQGLAEFGSGLNEPLIARRITENLPETHTLFLASSMPVRDVNRFGGTPGSPRVTVSNRGTSGIDGTIASAAGWSRATGRPVTLLIGDLASLHDLNSLAFLRRDDVQVTVVVINNDGGGIFHHLPVASQADCFEEFFGTPHGLSLEGAAAMFGLGWASPADEGSLIKQYLQAAGNQDSSLIEVVTDREQNCRLRNKLLT